MSNKALPFPCLELFLLEALSPTDVTEETGETVPNMYGDEIGLINLKAEANIIRTILNDSQISNFKIYFDAMTTLKYSFEQQ